MGKTLNWGYSTPLQKRFKKGDICKISEHKRETTPCEVGDDVVIWEGGRHDYLIDWKGKWVIVYQYELVFIKSKKTILSSILEFIFGK